MTLDYIAGLFDGEGHVVKAYPRLKLTQNRRDDRILFRIAAVLKQHGVTCVIRPRKAQAGCDDLYIERQRSILLFCALMEKRVFIKSAELAAARDRISKQLSLFGA